MSLQARVHRRLHKHRPSGTGHAVLAGDSHAQVSSATAANHPLDDPPHELLLSYLSADEDAAASFTSRGGDWTLLQAAAQALMHNGDSLRLGVRAGELPQRLRWFRRLLALWPTPERELWLAEQLAESQRHPMAASPLHDELDPRLFDPALSQEQQLGLQALWLAVVAPGAVSLDAGRRERELVEARSMMQHWLG